MAKRPLPASCLGVYHCRICGDKFRPDSPTAIYCGTLCGSKGRRRVEAYHEAIGFGVGDSEDPDDEG